MGALPVLGAPDRDAYRLGFCRVCGLDEAGRGPLAGPVVAAAVVLRTDTQIPGLGDSKQLSAQARRRLEPEIKAVARDWAVAVASPKEIDELNILQASLLAMTRAVSGLQEIPDYLLVDGNRPIPSAIPQQTIVGGDGLSTAVAAASVLAKEHRDALMERYASEYPGYGFGDHKGYPTSEHREALRRLGPCAIHRCSFRGVSQLTPRPTQTELFPTSRP